MTLLPNCTVRSRSLFLTACGACVLLLTAVYSNHFDNDFHFDDGHTIQNNLFIRDLRNIPLFFQSTKTFSANPANQSYRPLLTTTLALDYYFGKGLNPTMFHVTSFALFAIQCGAMLGLFRILMNRARPQRWNQWLALFAVAWYGLHTANAETLNYIIARSDILSTLGTVLAVLLFMVGGRARRWGLYLVPAAAAVLSKEQGAMAAPLVFLYAALFEHDLSIGELWRPRAIGRVLRATWPVFLVCGGLVAAGSRLADSWVPGGSSRIEYLTTQPFVLLHYALSFVLPMNLSADTDWKPIANPFDDRVIAGLIFVGSAMWAAIVASRRRDTQPIAFGILWFFIALLPTSSVVPLAEVTNDHRMFFPFVGAVLAATWAIALGVARCELKPWWRWLRPATIAACAVLLAAHGYGTRQRNRVWHSEESLWLDVTQKSPENGRGLMNYGLIQMERGELDAAADYFNRALQYTPRYAYLHVNLGILNGLRGDRGTAERHFRLAQRYAPDNPVSYLYYGRWLHRVGRDEEAASTVRRAVELSPANVAARHLLLDIAGQRRDWPLVATLARETVAIEPDDPTARSWLARAEQSGRHPEQPIADTRQPAGGGRRAISAEQWVAMSLVQYRAGEYEDAKHSSEEALRLQPDSADAFNNICASENAMGEYANADAACRRALEIRPGFTLARNNLAWAAARRQSSRD